MLLPRISNRSTHTSFRFFNPSAGRQAVRNVDTYKRRCNSEFRLDYRNYSSLARARVSADRRPIVLNSVDRRV